MDLEEKELLLKTQRLELEPVAPLHFQELWEIYSDQRLHAYVPPQPKTYEESIERFQRWSKRVSTKTNEILLNWVGREVSSGIIVGHFQAQFKTENSVVIGYIMKKESQQKGFAFEALTEVFRFLRTRLNAEEIKAWVDTRNEASIRLAKKLGMEQTELIKNYMVKDGVAIDDYVFTLKKRNTP